MHEVVVRNRLEQLRKRQRDEALQAQEELLAGVVNSAARKAGADAPVAEIQPEKMEVELVEETEPYDRSMSPGLLDITRLPAEERQIDIFTEEEDRRALVIILALQFGLILTIERFSLSNGGQSRHLALFPRRRKLRQRLRTQRQLVALI